MMSAAGGKMSESGHRDGTAAKLPDQPAEAAAIGRIKPVRAVSAPEQESRSCPE
jgi:hypothetical protein